MCRTLSGTLPWAHLVTRWILLITLVVGLLVYADGSVLADTPTSQPRYRIVRPPIVAFFREQSSGTLTFDVTVRLNRPLPRHHHRVLGSVQIGSAHSRRPGAYSDDPAPLDAAGRPRGYCYVQGSIQRRIPRSLRHPKVGQMVSVGVVIVSFTGKPQEVLARARLSRADNYYRPFLHYARRLGC